MPVSGAIMSVTGCLIAGCQTVVAAVDCCVFNSGCQPVRHPALAVPGDAERGGHASDDRLSPAARPLPQPALA